MPQPKPPFKAKLVRDKGDHCDAVIVACYHARLGLSYVMLVPWNDRAGQHFAHTAALLQMRHCQAGRGPVSHFAQLLCTDAPWHEWSLQVLTREPIRSFKQATDRAQVEIDKLRGTRAWRCINPELALPPENVGLPSPSGEARTGTTGGRRP